MAFTPEQAAALERNLRRLLTILEPQGQGHGANSRRRTGVLLSHLSETLIEVNALAEAAAGLAEIAGLGSIVRSLDEGWYGPLRIPAYQIEGALHVTDQAAAFALWRAAMERLVRDASQAAMGNTSRSRPVASAARYDASLPSTVPDSFPVVLGGPGDRPVVLGTPMPQLTSQQYKVLKVLADAVGVGFTEAALTKASGISDARKLLHRLRERHTEWAAVIHFPGACRGSGYKIDVPTPR